MDNGLHCTMDQCILAAQLLRLCSYEDLFAAAHADVHVHDSFKRCCGYASDASHAPHSWLYINTMLQITRYQRENSSEETPHRSFIELFSFAEQAGTDWS